MTTGKKDLQDTKKLLTQWIALVYSNQISTVLTWAERKNEASEKLGYTPSEDEIKEESREFFRSNTEAEYYWSLVIMLHNVCESLREQEVVGPDSKNNENTSYTSKIKNALNLKEVYDLKEKIKPLLFKGNEEAEVDFVGQKQFETTATILDKKRRNV